MILDVTLVLMETNNDGDNIFFFSLLYRMTSHFINFPKALGKVDRGGEAPLSNIKEAILSPRQIRETNIVVKRRKHLLYYMQEVTTVGNGD